MLQYSTSKVLAAAEAHPLAAVQAVLRVVAVVVAHTLVRQEVVAGEGLHICPEEEAVVARIPAAGEAEEVTELNRPDPMALEAVAEAAHMLLACHVVAVEEAQQQN
jgi:hypothetical protein